MTSTAARPAAAGAGPTGLHLPTAPLDRQAIAARIPHAGPMCLLDRALAWDGDTLLAESDRHRDTEHPLAVDGRLPATAAIEYAAQAMALHAALNAALNAAASLPDHPAQGHAPPDHAPPGRPVPARSGPASGHGLLVAVRDVRLGRRWIAADTPTLAIRVTRTAGDATQVLYAFSVDADGPLAHGRATVMLAAPGAAR